MWTWLYGFPRHCHEHPNRTWTCWQDTDSWQEFSTPHCREYIYMCSQRGPAWSSGLSLSNTKRESRGGSHRSDRRLLEISIWPVDQILLWTKQCFRALLLFSCSSPLKSSSVLNMYSVGAVTPSLKVGQWSARIRRRNQPMMCFVSLMWQEIAHDVAAELSSQWTNVGSKLCQYFYEL